jgi:hypothetical protein
MVELCVIHRPEEMVEEEAALDLALVTVVGGSRLPVSIVAVEVWLHTQFGIPSADIVVRRYQPEDFLICFSFLDDMLWVLHDRPLANPPFTLVFKRWHRQLNASAEKLFFRVTVALSGIPTHAWQVSIAQ